MRAWDLQRPLQGVAIAALGEQHLLFIRAGKARDNFRGGRVVIGDRLRLQPEINLRGFAGSNRDIVFIRVLEIRELDLQRIGARLHVRPGGEGIFAGFVGINSDRDIAVVQMRLHRDAGERFASGGGHLAGQHHGILRGGNLRWSGCRRRYDQRRNCRTNGALCRYRHYLFLPGSPAAIIRPMMPPKQGY